MLPPPMGGQALMFQRAVHGLQGDYELEVIDTQFQKNLGEFGKLSMRKVLRFFTPYFWSNNPVGSTKKFDILILLPLGPAFSV